MLENALKEFDKYAHNYDLNHPAIDLKYNHTFRVTNYAKKILESINASNHMMDVGCIAAMLHDIARFEQFTQFNTYEDKASFDHGDMGAQILLEDDYINNFVKDDYDKRVIVNAVLKHNKLDLELTGDEFEDAIAKVVRDADKLDIMIEQGNELKDPNYQINEKLLDDIFHHRSCNYKNVICSDDPILVLLGFVFDVNYKKTFEIVKESKIINKKIHILKEYNNDSKIDLIKEKIDKYIDEKIGDDKYVRN